jgi:hypothetical protein
MIYDKVSFLSLSFRFSSFVYMMMIFGMTTIHNEQEMMILFFHYLAYVLGVGTVLVLAFWCCFIRLPSSFIRRPMGFLSGHSGPAHTNWIHKHTDEFTGRSLHQPSTSLIPPHSTLRISAYTSNVTYRTEALHTSLDAITLVCSHRSARVYEGYPAYMSI